MKSICIKTNCASSIEYLLEKLNNLSLERVCYSQKKFKNYNNIIIHCTNKNAEDFLFEISNILANLVIDLFEEKIIEKIIAMEYFYFSKEEKIQIANITLEDLYDEEESLFQHDKAFQILINDFFEYLQKEKSIVLKGFITFRIKNFIEVLSDQIDKSVSKFIVEREYKEFISLLRLYVRTEKKHAEILHLLYMNSESILLDSDKNIIKTNNNLSNIKYLSDITFSTNDYILNELLSLNPKKIYIHLIDKKIDEFINTLKLVFEENAIFCTDCNICNIYKIHQKFSQTQKT